MDISFFIEPLYQPFNEDIEKEFIIKEHNETKHEIIWDQPEWTWYKWYKNGYENPWEVKTLDVEWHDMILRLEVKYVKMDKRRKRKMMNCPNIFSYYKSWFDRDMYILLTYEPYNPNIRTGKSIMALAIINKYANCNWKPYILAPPEKPKLYLPNPYKEDHELEEVEYE